MLVLGIDPGTAITGWGLVSREGDELALVGIEIRRADGTHAQLDPGRRDGHGEPRPPGHGKARWIDGDGAEAPGQGRVVVRCAHDRRAGALQLSRGRLGHEEEHRKHQSGEGSNRDHIVLLCHDSSSPPMVMMMSSLMSMAMT